MLDRCARRPLARRRAGLTADSAAACAIQRGARVPAHGTRPSHRVSAPPDRPPTPVSVGRASAPSCRTTPARDRQGLARTRCRAPERSRRLGSQRRAPRAAAARAILRAPGATLDRSRLPTPGTRRLRHAARAEGPRRLPGEGAYCSASPARAPRNQSTAKCGPGVLACTSASTAHRHERPRPLRPHERSVPSDLPGRWAQRTTRSKYPQRAWCACASNERLAPHGPSSARTRCQRRRGTSRACARSYAPWRREMRALAVASEPVKSGRSA